MKELIDIFRMNELSIETRVNIIIQLGIAINHQYGANMTEPVVYELVKALDPNHKILSDSFYSRHIKQ